MINKIIVIFIKSLAILSFSALSNQSIAKAQGGVGFNQSKMVAPKNSKPIDLIITEIIEDRKMDMLLIEIYNPTDDEIDLTNYNLVVHAPQTLTFEHISRTLEDKITLELKQNGTIKAKSHLIVAAVDQLNPRYMNTGFVKQEIDGLPINSQHIITRKSLHYINNTLKSTYNAYKSIEITNSNRVIDIVVFAPPMLMTIEDLLMEYNDINGYDRKRGFPITPKTYNYPNWKDSNRVLRHPVHITRTISQSRKHPYEENYTRTTADWVGTGFPTPGGDNYMGNGIDADNDGLPDDTEVKGKKFNGLDLYAMGAKPGQQDMFIEIDAMENTYNIIERREIYQKIKEAYEGNNYKLKQQGQYPIKVHIDVGFMNIPDFNLNNHQDNNILEIHKKKYLPARHKSLTEHYRKMREDKIVTKSYEDSLSMLDAQLMYSDIRRKFIFQYVVFGGEWFSDSTKRGLSFTDGTNNAAVITKEKNIKRRLKGIKLQNYLINHFSYIATHEIGHNLGLDHGGEDNVNYKPNYHSSMNYNYSGIATSGFANGDEYNAGLTDLIEAQTCQEEQSPPLKCISIENYGKLILDMLTRDPKDVKFVFSNGQRPDINENDIDENIGIGINNDPFDSNMDGYFEKNVIYDLNRDNKLEVLKDYDDWKTIVKGINILNVNRMHVHNYKYSRYLLVD